MSELQDAAQIIRVTFEGAEVVLKVGQANWEFVKSICALFKSMLEQEKLAGKTSVKQLLKNGGDLQVFKFETKDLNTVKQMADKYGVLYSILPDINKADGMSEILFHSQAAPRIKAIMEQVQNSEIESMEDYIDNAEPEELKKMEQQAEKKSKVPDEKEYKLVAEEFSKNPGAKASDIRFRLNMTWLEIWPIIKHMEQSGIAELTKDGAVSMKMAPEHFAEFLDSQQWKALFGEEQARGRNGEAGEKKLEEIRRIHKESKDVPNLNAITIDRKMVLEETEKHIKTRIPYRKNEYIWLNKSEISWINADKTIYAGLEKDKNYAVLDLENKPVRTISGQKLYEQSYDAVSRNRIREEQNQVRKRQRQKQHQQDQRVLDATRRALQGKGAR